MRVHELAKELGLTSKELLAKLHELGVEAKSHMSKLEDDAIELMLETTGDKSTAPAESTPAEAEATPEPEAEPEAEAEAAPVPTAPEPVAADEPAVETDTAVKQGKVITVRAAVPVKEMAELLEIRPNQVIAELMGMNVLVSITQRVEINDARKLAEQHGFELKHEKRTSEHSQGLHKPKPDEVEEQDRPEDMQPRPPVVTFLGHVDHGKTSLLDKIKHSAVAQGESGGITQHIGAYTVDVSGRHITFLDTPGHAAFNAMRARGANLTDIAVIIIAADDGLMPQTREAIAHAQDAGVTMIAALNKIDLPSANVDRVKQQLQAEGLSPEDWGELICCPVSAETGEGLDHLLEMILLQAEILELTANPTRRGQGFVIEAQLEPGMGPTAHLLVANGTLNVGNYILSGGYSGRVKALVNDHGIKLKAARPGQPVKCLGLSGVPEAGAEFRVYKDEKAARVAAEQERQRQKEEQLVGPPQVETTAENLFEQLAVGEKLQYHIILKADTQGSLEAITQTLHAIQSDKVGLNIVHSATGNVTVSDAERAAASGATIYGFTVGKEPGVNAVSKRENIEIVLERVIYVLFDHVRDAMTELLPPVLKEVVRGRALVKQIFSLGKRVRIAGCIVTSGNVTPSYKARVLRSNEVIREDSVNSLRHFQDEVSEVRESQECGIGLNGFIDFEEGDILEFYEVEQVRQTLE